MMMFFKRHCIVHWMINYREKTTMRNDSKVFQPKKKKTERFTVIWPNFKKARKQTTKATKKCNNLIRNIHANYNFQSHIAPIKTTMTTEWITKMRRRRREKKTQIHQISFILAGMVSVVCIWKLRNYIRNIRCEERKKIRINSIMFTKHSIKIRKSI